MTSVLVSGVGAPAAPGGATPAAGDGAGMQADAGFAALLVSAGDAPAECPVPPAVHARTPGRDDTSAADALAGMLLALVAGLPDPAPRAQALVSGAQAGARSEAPATSDGPAREAIVARARVLPAVPPAANADGADPDAATPPTAGDGPAVATQAGPHDLPVAPAGQAGGVTHASSVARAVRAAVAAMQAAEGAAGPGNPVAAAATAAAEAGGPVVPTRPAGSDRGGSGLGGPAELPPTLPRTALPAEASAEQSQQTAGRPATPMSSAPGGPPTTGDGAAQTGAVRAVLPPRAPAPDAVTVEVPAGLLTADGRLEQRGEDRLAVPGLARQAGGGRRMGAPDAGSDPSRIGGAALVPGKDTSPLLGTMAADPSAEAGAVDPARVLAQVTDAVWVAVDRGQRQAVVRLRPPELGRVEARVRLRDGLLEVDLRAEMPQTRELLGMHLADLQNVLQRLDGGPSQVSVQLSAGWGGDGRHGGDRERPDLPWTPAWEDTAREQGRDRPRRQDGDRLVDAFA